MGVLLVLITSLFGIPQPLIMRYLVHDVILGHQLGLLAIAVILLAGIYLAEKSTDLLQQLYFARFVQEVTLDIREDVFSHVLRFPKGFHQDPADQIIVATSRILGMPLLTSDRKILDFLDVEAVW